MGGRIGPKGGTVRPFIVDFEDAAKDNDAFRRVLATSEHAQITAMTIGEEDEMGLTTLFADQIVFVIKGDAEIIAGDLHEEVAKDALVVVPAGVPSNIRNIGDKALRLINVVVPPMYEAGAVHFSKEDAAQPEVVG